VTSFNFLPWGAPALKVEVDDGRGRFIEDDEVDGELEAIGRGGIARPGIEVRKIWN
jgi:hypothetical protein